MSIKRPRYQSEPKDFIPTCLSDIMTDEERAELGLNAREEQALFNRLMKKLLAEARVNDRRNRRADTIRKNLLK